MNRIKFSSDGVKRISNLLNEFKSEKNKDAYSKSTNMAPLIKDIKLKIYLLNTLIELNRSWKM